MKQDDELNQRISMCELFLRKLKAESFSRANVFLSQQTNTFKLSHVVPANFMNEKLEMCKTFRSLDQVVNLFCLSRLFTMMQAT